MAFSRSGLARAVPVLLIAAAALVMLAARQATSPTAAGYRIAMAPAPGGGLYVVRGGALWLAGPGRRATRVGPAPAAVALAADGPLLLLGADGGLFLSRDGGRAWSRAGVPGGRFLALAASGRTLLAGSWGGRLWLSRDAGGSWGAASVPAGGTEFESIAIAPGLDLAATETGMIGSRDGGLTWTRVSGLPDRMTAVVAGPETGYLAADWRGRIYASSDGVSWRVETDLGRGVWALGGGRAATISGLYDLASRRWAGPPLAGVEVPALAGSDGSLYAAVARGPVYGLVAGRWEAVLQP